MEDLKYFIVQVKLEMETDMCDKAGNPKNEEVERNMVCACGEHQTCRPNCS